MKSFHAYSLRTKIIVFIFLIVTLFLGAFQTYSYFELKSRMINELNDIADDKIQRLSQDLEIPMWELDEIWIQKLLKTELMDEKVHAVVVSGDENILLRVHRDDDTVKKHEDKNVVSRTRSIMHNGVKIGAVNLYLSKDLMQKKLVEELINVLTVTFFEFIVVIIFLWIMLRRVILSPIDALIVSTKRIANGDYTHRQLKLENDEIGALGDAIFKMSNNIQERERELRETNEELISLKERLEYAVKGSNDGLWDWNIESHEVYFSPRWKEMLGYADSELSNAFTTWEERVHPDDIEQAKSDIALCHANPGIFYSNIHRMLHKDGYWVWILARGQTIFDAQGKAVRMVGFHTDITKQKELERELLEQEEMMIAQSRHVAMGEMIGMIAHQWRQPISVIAMGANNMLLDVQFDQVSNESIEKEAREILMQTEHLSKTIDDFRNFFRPNKNKEETKIIDILMEAKEMIGKSLESHNITLSVHSDETETILTYSREILQVILNIFKNAQEAMGQNNVHPGHIDASVEDRGDSLMISISDNAGGIEESVLSRIFEPYFSTKDKKTGTGLGLYMSKTIIDKHLHGSINAYNIDGGVKFTIMLPKIVHEGESDV